MPPKSTPPEDQVYTPLEVYAASTNALIACSRAIDVKKIPASHRRYLREFGEELIAALCEPFDQLPPGTRKVRRSRAREIQPEELVLTLAVLLRFAVVKAYPEGLPAAAYRGEGLE